MDPYHRRESEMAGDLLNVTQLVSLREGSHMWVCLTVDPMLFHRPDIWVLSSGTRPSSFIRIRTPLLAFVLALLPPPVSPLPWFPAGAPAGSPTQLIPDSHPKGLRAGGRKTLDPEVY